MISIMLLDKIAIFLFCSDAIAYNSSKGLFNFDFFYIIGPCKIGALTHLRHKDIAAEFLLSLIVAQVGSRIIKTCWLDNSYSRYKTSPLVMFKL